MFANVYKNIIMASRIYAYFGRILHCSPYTIVSKCIILLVTHLGPIFCVSPYIYEHPIALKVQIK